MKKLLLRRPSAAMVIAIVALVAALAGNAIAGGGTVNKKKFIKKISSLEQSVSTLNRTVGTKVGGPLTYVSTTVRIPVNYSPGSNGTAVIAACPAGTAPTGGGIKVGSDAAEYVSDSHPTVAGWGGTVFNFGSATHTATVMAVCAVTTGTGSRPAE